MKISCRRLLFISLILTATGFFMCVNEIAGGGSTETIGKVSFCTGEPAPEVDILFVPEDFQPWVDTLGSSIKSTISDQNGHYSFSNLPNGNYNIFFEKHDLKAYRRAVEISDGRIRENISDTLHKPGSVSGVVRLLDHHDNRNVFILVTGSNRYVTPHDSSGNFTVKDFAQGEYNLKIIAGYDNYSIIDTSVIITSGVSDTLKDTLYLPYTGISSPESLAVYYDSSLLQVNLSWPKIISPNLGGYTVFRKEKGSEDNYSVINNNLVTDTFFIDLCDGKDTDAGRTYSYRVAAVDNEGISGRPGEAVALTFHQNTSFTDSLFIRSIGDGVITGMSHSFDSTLAIVFSDTSALFIIHLSEKSVVKVSLPENALPFSVSFMDDSTFLVATDKGIYNLDRQGTNLFWYNIQTTMMFSRESRYIYYVSRSVFHTDYNNMQILDTYTGIHQLFTEYANSEVHAVAASETTVYSVSGRYNQIFLKATDLETQRTRELFSPVENVTKSTVTATDTDLFITYDKAICQLSLNDHRIISRKIASDRIEATVCPPDLRTLFFLSKDGYLHSAEL